MVTEKGRSEADSWPVYHAWVMRVTPGLLAVTMALIGCGARTSTLSDDAVGGSGAGSGGDDASGGDASDDAPSGPSGTGCFHIEGSGADEVCGWVSRLPRRFGECASLLGYAEGSCPTAGLYGCCVTDIASVRPAEAAVCYYSAEGLGSNAQVTCATSSGGTASWQATAP